MKVRLQLGLVRQMLGDSAGARAAYEPVIASGTVLARITLTYADCLPEHPNRLPRVLALARRTWAPWVATHAPTRDGGGRQER
jgi:hypothetical protein